MICDICVSDGSKAKAAVMTCRSLSFGRIDSVVYHGFREERSSLEKQNDASVVIWLSHGLGRRWTY